jgi:hypothetical protein
MDPGEAGVESYIVQEVLERYDDDQECVSSIDEYLCESQVIFDR